MPQTSIKNTWVLASASQVAQQVHVLITKPDDRSSLSVIRVLKGENLFLQVFL